MAITKHLLLYITKAIPNTRSTYWKSSGAELHAIAAHAGGASVLDFQPGGRQLVADGADTTLKLWDVQTGALKRTIEKFNPAAIAYSPDGKMLAAVELTQPK